MAFVRDFGSQADLSNGPFLYSSPSAETQEDERRAEQVVGAINAQRNASMKDIPSPSTNDSSPPFLKITKDFSHSDSCVIPPQAAEASMKSMARMGPSPQEDEQSETSPPITTNEDNLLQDEPPVKRSPRSRRLCFCTVFTALLVIVCSLGVLTVFLVRLRTLKSSESNVVVYGMNDTILAAQADREFSNKLSLKLVSESDLSLHIVHIYSSPCDKLLSHNSTVKSSAILPIDSPHILVFPSYYVHGSHIEVLANVLNVSVIDVNIKLYIFNNLDLYFKFASKFDKDKSVFQATIYSAGPGVQNTSTFVNYTVPSTGYYFVAIDADFSIIAQFDVTLHREFYNASDYAQSCVIKDSDKCSLSASDGNCILVHSTYPPDVVWEPAIISVAFDAGTINSQMIIAIIVVVTTLSVILSSSIVVYYYCCYCKSKSVLWPFISGCKPCNRYMFCLCCKYRRMYMYSDL